MSVFVRRFLTDPGDEVFLEIESVNILDLEPPASITGLGSGTAMIVGEFENGPFNTPTEIASADDLLSTFGGFGFARNGVVGCDPCARSRKADAAINAETWNGNGHVQLSGKKFKRLVLVRVDTSVGTVQFTRLSSAKGKAAFAYNLEPGQLLAIKLNGAAAVNATFTATAATVTGVGGVYPSTFAGNETLTLGFDDSSLNPDFTVTFLAADQSAAQVAARINIYAGFTFADTSGGQLRFTARKRGAQSQVRIVGGSTGVLAKLGLTAANTNGTGNVNDIDSVKFSELKSIVEGAVAGTTVDQDSTGAPRIIATTAGVTLEVATTSTADDFGFSEGVVYDGTTGSAGTIPAGTLVQNSGATVKLVTMQDIDVTSSAGPYSVKVRHATDDGSGISANAGTITVVSGVDLAAFAVTNPSLIPAALSESAIDSAYDTAFDSTLDPATVAKEVNLVWSARQSNSIRRKGLSNVLDASANGMQGRLFFGRPPMGTPKTGLISTTAEPGVGAYRDQRFVYCAPGVTTKIRDIATRGTGGGTGFTATGIVDVGWDGFVASICSQLAPEEDPGQSTSYAVNAISLESYWTGKTLKMADYITFKKSGVCAPSFDGGLATIQSSVTSVDPMVHPGLTDINRRRMADFIQDSIAARAKAFGKLLSRKVVRKSLLGEIKMFAETLLSRTDPSKQRIYGYTLSDKANTAASLGKGLYRIVLDVRSLSSLKAIVIATTIGPEVTVEEIIPEAA